MRHLRHPRNWGDLAGVTWVLEIVGHGPSSGPMVNLCPSLVSPLIPTELNLARIRHMSALDVDGLKKDNGVRPFGVYTRAAGRDLVLPAVRRF